MLVYGWVSAQIQNNWAAWSSWKEKGDKESSEKFYKETVDEAEDQGLTWFCYEQD
jgi:hypothetical protein